MRDALSKNGNLTPPMAQAPLDTYGFRLTHWARTRPARERAAVSALLEDHALLARPKVRDLFLTESANTTNTTDLTCDWERLARNLHSPVLTPPDREFLRLLLSLASCLQVHLGTAFTDIGTPHRAIVLRAMIAATTPEEGRRDRTGRTP